MTTKKKALSVYEFIYCEFCEYGVKVIAAPSVKQAAKIANEDGKQEYTFDRRIKGCTFKGKPSVIASFFYSE